MYRNKPNLNPDGSVPGSYYDADYYENGAKSGKMSYNGNSYENNPELCKYWAKDAFTRWGPFKRYLELGCGRGWAIWGLMLQPDLGIEEMLGIDISEYAISTAVNDIHRYLRVGDISNLGFLEDGSFDLVFSNDVLEHLTPDQLTRCLTHCKRISNRVVHLISIGDGVDLPFGDAPANQDQSHVTIRSRDWWETLFRQIFDEKEWRIFIISHGSTIEVDCTKRG